MTKHELQSTKSSSSVALQNSSMFQHCLFRHISIINCIAINSILLLMSCYSCWSLICGAALTGECPPFPFPFFFFPCADFMFPSASSPFLLFFSARFSLLSPLFSPPFSPLLCLMASWSILRRNRLSFPSCRNNKMNSRCHLFCILADLKGVLHLWALFLKTLFIF